MSNIILNLVIYYYYYYVSLAILDLLAVGKVVQSMDPDTNCYKYMFELVVAC